MLRNFLSIEDSKNPVKSESAGTLSQTKGFVYNSLKIRAGFLNRVKIVKDELAKLDKAKKPKPAGYVEDTSISTLQVIMRVIHSYYRENDYIIKQIFSMIVEDESVLH